jgi:hypothetical protein
MSVEEVRQASDRFYATLNRALNGEITDDMLDIFPRGRRHDDAPYRRPAGRLAGGPLQF